MPSPATREVLLSEGRIQVGSAYQCSPRLIAFIFALGIRLR